MICRERVRLRRSCRARSECGGRHEMINEERMDRKKTKEYGCSTSSIYLGKKEVVQIQHA